MPYSEELDLCQESQIRHQRGHVGKKTIQGSYMDYITEEPDLHHQLGMPRAPILGYYSLSDFIWLTAFSPQKVCFCLPNLANLLGALPRVCINILFV